MAIFGLAQTCEKNDRIQTKSNLNKKAPYYKK